MPLHEIFPSLLPRLLIFPKRPVWRKVNVASHPKALKSIDLIQDVPALSHKRATGSGRRRDDNAARLTNSWVEVSWLLLRRSEQSEELWCCEWMKWALCDSRCALRSLQEARPAQQPLVSQSKQHPQHTVYQPQPAGAFKSVRKTNYPPTDSVQPFVIVLQSVHGKTDKMMTLKHWRFVETSN